MYKIGNLFFIFLVLGLLFCIGVSFNFQEQIETENRRASPFPVIISRDGINVSFGIDFEKWLQDHITLRNTFIDVHSRFKQAFFEQHTKGVLFGSDGWLFMNRCDDSSTYNNMDVYQNVFKFTPADQKKIEENLAYVARFAKKNNIKVYIIIPPDKKLVYTEYMPSFLRRLDNPTIIDQFLKMKLPKSIRFVFPLEALLAAKKENPDDALYYKLDTHPTHLGAFVMYQELMKAIKQDFPDVDIRTKADYHFGTSQEIYDNAGNNMGNLNESLPESRRIALADRPMNTYLLYNKKDDVHVNWLGPGISEGIYKDGAPYNVYIIHTSFGLVFNQYLRQTFKHLKGIRFNEPGTDWGIKLKQREGDILKFKTDILIFDITDLRILQLTQML